MEIPQRRAEMVAAAKSRELARLGHVERLVAARAQVEVAEPRVDGDLDRAAGQLDAYASFGDAGVVAVEPPRP